MTAPLDTPVDTPPRIVADANIPAVGAAFGPLGSVRRIPGREIDRAAVRDADVLLVRSVTPVDAALLDGTAVRFVGSATAGTDHVDARALAALGVAFAHAPGSNATSVVEWVLAALLATAAERGGGLAGRTLGVVGAGQVGGRLVPRARALGMDVVACDPPLAAAAEARGEHHAYVPLDALLRRSDVVTLHTPLTAPGASAWPTRGLIGAGALAEMRPGAWLVNAARGGVVDGPALRGALERGRLADALLDVWPGEPAPDPDLVARARWATPHVAGYSLDGKVAGTAALARALRQWLADRGRPARPWDPAPALAPDAPLVVDAPPPPPNAADPAVAARWLDGLARQAYGVRADTARFRAGVDWDAPPAARAADFARLRKTYPVRREWAGYAVRGDVPPSLRAAVRDGLAMRLGG
jgi:erythronate-4-phosphate dehydrogenase